jgi:putative sigma-54 modulation protein
MTQPHEPFPVHIRMRWLDFSPSLHWYTGRRMESALRRFAPRIRAVNVQIADGNGPRGGDDKVCEVEILVHPSVSLMASAAAPDAYQSVARAAHRARAVVRAHLDRRFHRDDRPSLKRIA